MKMHGLKSSMLASYGYDAATKTLTVKFLKGGKTYHYSGVSPEIAEGLGKSTSPGGYLATHIRGKFQHQAAEKRA